VKKIMNMGEMRRKFSKLNIKTENGEIKFLCIVSYKPTNVCDTMKAKYRPPSFEEKGNEIIRELPVILTAVRYSKLVKLSAFLMEQVSIYKL
jgi:hypothetical protein